MAFSLGVEINKRAVVTAAQCIYTEDTASTVYELDCRLLDKSSQSSQEFQFQFPGGVSKIIVKRSASHKQQRLHHYRGIDTLSIYLSGHRGHRRMKNHSTE